MEKKNNIIYSILVVAMFLFLIISATYAYFLNSKSIENMTVNAELQAMNASFTSYISDQIEINVSSDKFINPSTNPSVTDEGLIYVEFAANSASNMHCTYDIDLVWDSTEQYIAPSFPLPYEGSYNYELSIVGSRITQNDTTGHVYANKNLSEINITDLQWQGNAGSVGRYAKLVTGAEIYSSSATATRTTWTFSVNFYTLPSLQDAVMGKNYSAHLEVSNVVC